MEKLFKDYWEGKVPLVKSYWIGCILIPIALVIPILPALGGGRVSDGYAMFTVLWFFAMTAANIYLLIGGFRSATIYVAAKKKEETKFRLGNSCTNINSSWWYQNCI